MYEINECPRIKVIGLGSTGENIVKEILINIPSLDYIILDEDINKIDKEKEYEINDFFSDTSVMFIIGFINESTCDVLNMIVDIGYIDTFMIAMLTLDSRNKDAKLLNGIIPNTIIVESYASIEIYKVIINLLISTYFSSNISRYSPMLTTNIDDLKLLFSSGNKYSIGYGRGIGYDRARNAVLMAINNKMNMDKENIFEYKMIMFLFNLPTNIAFFEIEDSIEMFKEKYNYKNDISFKCIFDTMLPLDELEVSIIMCK